MRMFGVEPTWTIDLKFIRQFRCDQSWARISPSICWIGAAKKCRPCLCSAWRACCFFWYWQRRSMSFWNQRREISPEHSLESGISIVCALSYMGRYDFYCNVMRISAKFDGSIYIYIYSLYWSWKRHENWALPHREMCSLHNFSLMHVFSAVRQQDSSQYLDKP